MVLSMEYTETLKLRTRGVLAGWHLRGCAYSELRQRIETAVIDLWAILSVRSINNVMGHYHYGPLAGSLMIR